MHRVVITGMGLTTALGPNLATVWPRLLAGDNGIAPITYFDASQYDCRVAAEVRVPPVDETGLESIPFEQCRRGVRLFLGVCREAWADAGLDVDRIDPRRVGVAAGTSVNYVHAGLIREHYRFRQADAAALDLPRFAGEGGVEPPFHFHRRLGEMTATVPARALGLAGPTLAIDTACAASAFAIGEACRLIARGRAHAMLAGGAASLVAPVGILAFSVLGALSRNPDPDSASRPFDRRRDGFVMGEGGGALLLERRDLAVARGAHIYAEVVGYGATLNAHNLTDPSPDGAAEVRAMELALADAGLAPDQVDYIAAHGTSTPKNDAAETAAIKQVYGAHARRLAVSSCKGQLGHTISAAGVCNAICAVKAVSDGEVPPTAHYGEPDPVCDLDYVPNVGRQARVRAAVAHAFAFGGQNAVLAVTAA
jgi:3-oxoacyl-[acyl-carrier-protein] synthase II